MLLLISLRAYNYKQLIKPILPMCFYGNSKNLKTEWNNQ
jgi:hypothetical protein